MATEVLQRAAIIQKAEEMRVSSVKLATVQGFDLAAVINLIVHASPKDTLQALIDDPQKLETEMLRAYHTIKLIETRPGVSGQSLFPLLQDVEPELIKQLSKESLSCILESIPHGVMNEARELTEINRCNEFIRQQSEKVSRAEEETRNALDSLEAMLEEAETLRWNGYVRELQDLLSVMPPQALKKAQAGDVGEAIAIINRETSEIESKKVTIHQDPDSVARLQQDDFKLARFVEEVERTWREVSSYEERIVNASVAEISGRLRSSVNDQVRQELSAALDAAEQSVADVDVLLKEKAAFDAALEAATERAIASLCSDVTLRTQAMLQSQEHSSLQLGVTDVCAVGQEEWCNQLDQGLASVTQLVEQDLLEKHRQFIEAYEQAQKSVRPTPTKHGRREIRKSGFASFEHVVQGEFARLDAELEGIRATTLKALQERPAHYTNALSSRVKELQAKAEEILGTMQYHMVDSMINTSKAKAEEYVRECRANLRAATPRHANWSLVEELAGVEDDKLVDKARELVARAQQHALALEPELESKLQSKLETKPDTRAAATVSAPTNQTSELPTELIANEERPDAHTSNPPTAQPSVGVVETHATPPAPLAPPAPPTPRTPPPPPPTHAAVQPVQSESTSDRDNEDDIIVVAKVPFQFSTKPQPSSEERKQVASKAVATPHTQPQLQNQDGLEPCKESTENLPTTNAQSPQTEQNEQQAPGSPIVQPIAQAPASPPPGPVFRPSLFKSNIFKTIDK